MGKILNPFSFGTGDIDKDQWLRDIDNELEDFITRYGSVTNKHRTALLRQAFQDLRGRIANGDMLNRTADGLYQFGSALIRDDKHMQEAYQRALGFMGDLARRQLSTPAPEPEKNKITGSTIEDEFKKSLGPDGRFNEKAYWARTPEARGQGLLQFLTGFKNRLNDYQDFSSFTDKAGLESKLDAAIKALNDKKYNDWSLSQLGFVSDWINKPAEEPTEQPKSELDQLEEELTLQISDFTRRLNIENQRKQLLYALDSKFLLDIPLTLPEYSYEDDLNKHTPSWGNQGQARSDFYNSTYFDLSNYFSKLGVDWRNLTTMQGIAYSDFLHNLSRLFSKTKSGQYPYQGIINNLFIPTNDGRFLLKGTNEENDRLVFYNPNDHRFEVRGYFYNQIPSLKQGGIINFLTGGEFNFDEWDKLNNPQYYSKTQASTLQKTINNSEDEKSKEEMTTGDWVNILGPVILDIGSMLAANVPGYGTLASGIAGLGSTIWSGINDASQGRFSATGTLASLGADVFGLVPGWGMSAKVGKMASKFLRYSKPIMYAFTARGLTDASKVFSKGLNQGFDSLDKNDWEQLAAGFTSLMGGAVKGTAAVKRSNLQEMRRASASKKTFDYIDSNGDIKSKTVGINNDISGELRVSRPKISADKEGVIKGRTQALDGFNAGYGIASNKHFGMLYELARQGDVPLHSWETWEWKVPRLINTDKAKQQLMKLRGSLKPKTETPKAETPKTETKPKTESKKKTTPKKKKTEAEKKQIGGILYALRNGGIIKAESGIKFGPDANWYNDVFSYNKSTILNGLKNNKNYYTWLNDMQDAHAEIYNAAGGASNTWIDNAYKNPLVKTYQEKYSKDPLGINFNDYGITKADHQHENGGLPKHYIYDGNRANLDNANVGYQPDGLYSAITDDRRLLGRVGDYGENLQSFKDELKSLGYNLIEGGNGYYKLEPLTLLTNDTAAPVAETSKTKDLNGDKKSDKAVADALSGIDTKTTPEFKNPYDPSLGLIASKVGLGLLGNKNIYGNLLKEMPQAPLRDPIDRKLAIVGWQEKIKEAQNQLADLRHATWMQHGSSQADNLAAMYETEGKGFGIMNRGYDLDSGRQFETAGQSWNLDNEDTLYNAGVGDANRKSIADRARMMAQIRAAWRSGDLNILMGGLADASNWLLKKYQREQDLVDKTKELALGSLESFADWSLRNNPTYKELLAKKQAGTLTEADRAKMLEIRYSVMDDLANQYAEKFYNLYHTPWFGGGYKPVIGAKDGTKLEIEKLKARGKDNDRYVSMIKDLRSTRRRRRR